MTRCASSIVLTLDPDLGRGIVLYSTPELWQYAAAREVGPAQPDPLYTLLHALSLKYRTAYAQHKAEMLKVEEARKSKTAVSGGGGSDGAAPRESLKEESLTPH
jgi:hypothetical protein